MKEFVIIGLGNFGATVARELAGRSDCRVTAIDTDRQRIQNLQEQVDVAVMSDATERKFLENLEVDKFDCIVVSTGVDSHASILIALYLKELGARKIVVKANSEDHAKILRKVGATETIIPEKMMAVRLSQSLAQTNFIDYLPLTGDTVVAEMTPPDNFVGKTLVQLNLRSRYNVQVVAVRIEGKGDFIYVPRADYLINADDVLVMLGHRKDIDGLKK